MRCKVRPVRAACAARWGLRGTAPAAIVEETKEEPGDALDEAVCEEHVGHCDHLSRESARKRESERAREMERERESVGDTRELLIPPREREHNRAREREREKQRNRDGQHMGYRPEGGRVGERKIPDSC